MNGYQQYGKWSRQAAHVWGLPDGDDRHGTPHAYRYYGCRCEPCRTAHKADRAVQRAKRRSLPVPDDAHGSIRGYTYYQCRCQPCRDAMNAYRRQWKAARS